MIKKFETVLEGALGRYTNNAGFLVGDYVRFAKNFKKDAAYDSLGSNVKELLDELNKTDKHIRVRGINNMFPSRAPGNIENTNGMVSITVAVDEGGGREYNYVTIPSTFLVPAPKAEFEVSPPPLPDSFNYDRKVVTSVKDAVDGSDADAMTGHKKEGNRKLPTTNTKLKHTKAPETAKYLAGF